jgi:hypothetical protein
LKHRTADTSGEKEPIMMLSAPQTRAQIGPDPSTKAPRAAGFRRAISVLLATAAIFSGGAASAHDFTAAVVVMAEDRPAALADAIRAMLLAADERDAHADETSDGHLGGVDVHLLPLPPEVAGQVEGLTGAPSLPADVVVILGSEPALSEAATMYQSDSAVLLQPVVPESWVAHGDMQDFVTRYQQAYGTAPSAVAASAYHAARRLDLAIRPLDGVEPRAALQDALQATSPSLP